MLQLGATAVVEARLAEMEIERGIAAEAVVAIEVAGGAAVGV